MRKIALPSVLLLLAGFWSIMAQERPKIEVIYPRVSQLVTARDSMFIFGNVTPASTLKINGVEVMVHPNGAFLAFLSIKPGSFTFRLEARLLEQTATLELPVQVPEPYVTPPKEPLTVVRGYASPSSDIQLMEGDILNTSFRGSPGYHAYFTVSSDKAVLPMVETTLLGHADWTETLWGNGDYPDSLVIGGVYTGVLTLERPHLSDSSRLVYFLCRKPLKTRDWRVAGFKRELAACGCVRQENKANVAVMPSGRVLVGELVDSAQTVRTGPRKGYLLIAQPQGIRFRITGSYRGYFRAQLVPGQEAWLPDSSVRLLPQGAQIPSGEVSQLRTQKADRGVVVSLNVGARLPFRLVEDIAADKAYLDIYNCTSNIDFIRYDPADSLIALIRWDQPQTGVLRLTLDLRQMLWGYDCYYEGNRFCLKLKSSPALDDKLKDVRFVIDPGHSPDPGAVGPTGLVEKDVNLAIALELARRLRKHDATVSMTREGDTPLPLYDRPKVAYQYDPDIFISIHNNALADGINPFFNNGASTYFYQPHSHELAGMVQRCLVEATGLRDLGVFEGNFAVIRPTGFVAILVESAFMMIPEQEAALRESSFQEKIAEAIVDGVIDFVNAEHEKRDSGR